MSADDTAPTTQPFDAGRPDIDTLAKMLANRRRRYVIGLLDVSEGPRGHLALAREVAAAEHDIPVAAVTSTQRERAYVSLYQNHLDQLDAADAVDWDGRGPVARGARFDWFAGALAALDTLSASAGGDP